MSATAKPCVRSRRSAAASWSRGPACAASSPWPRHLPFPRRCRRSAFPYRDLILLCAFTVVAGHAGLQGLTLKPLIRHIGLTDDDPVGREIRLGRMHAYSALLDAIKDDDTLAGRLLRKEYGAVVDLNTSEANDAPVDEGPAARSRRRAITVARQRAFELRRDDVIGDNAYRVLVQELDLGRAERGRRRGGLNSVSACDPVAAGRVGVTTGCNAAVAVARGCTPNDRSRLHSGR